MSLVLIISLSCAAGAEIPVSQELHHRCLSELRDTLEKGEEFIKVHAAESLLWTGHPDQVREVFFNEPQEVPKYRIGVWRVLAQADVPAKGAQA